MSIRAFPFVLSCVAPCLISAQEPRSLDGTRYAQMLYHERVVIRIPRVRPVTRAAGPDTARSPSTAPVAATPVWIEKRAADCVPVAALSGASIDRSGDVDLVVADGRRLRAKLADDCPTLDFYSGFYLKRTADGQICARRDSLRSRSGGRCAITGFRTLTAKR